jgi:hypothetical protein
MTLSRGVVRIYAMTFDDGVWILRRESADFTPLAFAQRFVGPTAIREAFDEAARPGGLRPTKRLERP